MEVAENLQELVEEEEGQVWETIEEIWPDYHGPAHDTVDVDIYEHWLEPA